MERDQSSLINAVIVPMDSERWMKARLDELKMKSVHYQPANINQKPLPNKLERRMFRFDPLERNQRGETLIIAVIRYLTEKDEQVRYVNLLVRAGCDASASDSKQLRTPLMLACMNRNEAVAQLLIQLNVDLTCQDRLGNTALMYATLYSQPEVVAILTNELTRQWSFDVFRTKNVMGYTAEALARKNGRVDCSRLLKRERLLMLQRMHKQLALIHLSATLKGEESVSEFEDEFTTTIGHHKLAQRQSSTSARPRSAEQPPVRHSEHANELGRSRSNKSFGERFPAIEPTVPAFAQPAQLQQQQQQRAKPAVRRQRRSPAQSSTEPIDLNNTLPSIATN